MEKIERKDMRMKKGNGIRKDIERIDERMIGNMINEKIEKRGNIIEKRGKRRKMKRKKRKKMEKVLEESEIRDNELEVMRSGGNDE